jgi:molybdate transport system regulatory protein
MPGTVSHARILSVPDRGRCLASVQLEKLEQAFRSWAEAPRRPDTRLSRRRILMIFLLIRYTGARLNEVLHLDPSRDIDCRNHLVHLRKGGAGSARPGRTVEISESLSTEIQNGLDDPDFKGVLHGPLWVDPGHIRRKFYERAEAIGLPRELGTPEAIRRSRAVELLQGNMPLPVVQKILGHSTPNLAASYVEFSDDEIRHVARTFVDRESRRKTSARNAFFGKVNRIRTGDVQAMVEIASVAGYHIIAAITNDSLTRLGLKRGSLVMAEVKAPWVLLYKGKEEPRTSAENIFHGDVRRITSGRVTAEVVVEIPDGTELCAIITAESGKRLRIREKDILWVAFNAFAVVLHVD